MKCMKCGHEKSIVLETRDDGEALYRRRACKSCGKVVKTVERLYDGKIPDKRPPRERQAAAGPKLFDTSALTRAWR